MMTVLGEITRKIFPPESPAISSDNPHLNPNLPLLPAPIHLGSNVSIIMKLKETFLSVMNKGCVVTEDIRLLEGLVKLGGTRWTSEKLIQVRESGGCVPSVWDLCLFVLLYSIMNNNYYVLYEHSWRRNFMKRNPTPSENRL